MFVHVILVHMVKMAVVKIIHMAVMANRSVPAFRAMLMRMIGMMLFGAGGHRVFPLFDGGAALLTFSGMFDGAFHQTQNVSVGE